jgi:hypothetical protein
VSQARALLDQQISETKPFGRFQRGLTLTFWAGGFLWIFPFVFSFLCPPGAGLSVFGFALQTRSGRSAGRIRCAARSLFAWLPFAFFFPTLATAAYLGYAPAARAYWRSQSPAAATFLLEGYAGGVWTIEVVLGGIVLLGIAYSLSKPARGLPDVLAGTWLVPK